MDVQQLLVAQQGMTFDATGWFAPLEQAIRGLTSEESAWKPSPEVHSVREIVDHLRYWNGRFLDRFMERPVGPAAANDESFRSGEVRWEEAKAGLFEVMKGWKQALAEATPERLAAPLSADDATPWSMVVAHLTLHSACHVGQIILLRKLGGSWSAELSVS